jgi:opacity protein-like surface antigen
MIRKFAAVPGCKWRCSKWRWTVVSAILSFVMILAGAATLVAQQAPAQPPAQQAPSQPAAAHEPDNQRPSSQEASQEESTSRRKVRPRAYKNWSFNVGGGASVDNGATKTYVRGGGVIATAGVARNYSKYFGLRADFQWDNLPLRNSALQLAQARGATSQAYSVMVDPIINLPVTTNWGGYVLFGPAYVHRSGKLDSSTALPGSACNGFFVWWGACFNGSLPINGKFLSQSQNEFGFNFGGGITRKIRPNLEVYAEFRYVRGTHSGIQTAFRPITLGLRW